MKSKYPWKTSLGKNYEIYEFGECAPEASMEKSREKRKFSPYWTPFNTSSAQLAYTKKKKFDKKEFKIVADAFVYKYPNEKMDHPFKAKLGISLLLLHKLKGK